jgi:hypothetical protein
MTIFCNAGFEVSKYANLGKNNFISSILCLAARKWNVDAAETMFREHIKWRERWGADDIENQELPQVVLDYTPVGHAGYDKEGSPIIVIPFAGFDIYGMLHAASPNDIYRHRIQFMERILKLADEKYEETENPNVRHVVGIVDMSNFSLRPFLWVGLSEGKK